MKELDFATVFIEFLTSAYEKYKLYKASRMTLYLAYEIANVYMETDKVDMGLKYLCLIVHSLPP
jgi:hypothetical protein